MGMVYVLPLPSWALSISLDSRLVLFWTLSLTDGRDLSRCKPNMSLPLSPPLGAPGEQTPQTVLFEITRRWQGGDSREALDMAGAWEPDSAARGMNASGPAAVPSTQAAPRREGPLRILNDADLTHPIIKFSWSSAWNRVLHEGSPCTTKNEITLMSLYAGHFRYWNNLTDFPISFQPIHNSWFEWKNNKKAHFVHVTIKPSILGKLYLLKKKF